MAVHLGAHCLHSPLRQLVHPLTCCACVVKQAQGCWEEARRRWDEHERDLKRTFPGLDRECQVPEGILAGICVLQERKRVEGCAVTEM